MVYPGESGRPGTGNQLIPGVSSMKNKQAAIKASPHLSVPKGEFYNIPLIGQVHVENEWGSGGDYSLGELIRNYKKNDTRYLTLRAADDGLSAVGILQGDFLTVEMNRKPRNGDIAAVRLGERVFIRKTYFERGLIRLETTDPSTAPLIVDAKTPGFELLGKVHTVIREL